MSRAGGRPRLRSALANDPGPPIFERRPETPAPSRRAGRRRRLRRVAIASTLAGAGVALAAPATAQAGASFVVSPAAKGATSLVIDASFEVLELQCRQAAIGRAPATAPSGTVYINGQIVRIVGGLQVADPLAPNNNLPGEPLPCDRLAGIRALGTAGADLFRLRSEPTEPLFPLLNIAVDAGPGADRIYLDDAAFLPTKDTLLTFRVLVGGDGDDTVIGSAAADTLVGGAGNDSLDGGDGDDSAGGHEGVDEIEGGLGDDVLTGGFLSGALEAEDDVVDGGEGADTLTASGGADVIRGGPGADVLHGVPAGTDTPSLRTLLDGGSGNDVLRASLGPATLSGGRGNDTLMPLAGTRLVAGDICLQGGPGRDRVDFSYVGGGVIEAHGGPGSDHVRTGTADDRILGGPGVDTLYGGGGIDVIEGASGNDRLFGGGGGDTLSGGAGGDDVRGEAGDDRLRGDAGNHRLFGGPGDDSGNGGLGLDLMDGGPGRDACEAERQVRCEIEEIVLRLPLPALFRAFEANGVAYVAIGGVAAVAQGAQARTPDVDLVPAPEPENLERIAEALRELGTRVRVPVLPGVPRVPEGLPFPFERAAELPTSYTWSLLTPAVKLDLMFRPSGVAGYEELVEQARSATIGGVTARIAWLADVIRIKEAAGRAKDLRALPRLYRALEQSRRHEHAARWRA